MFFVKELEHSVTLHPSFFAGDARQKIEERLRQDTEGICSGGMVIVLIIGIDLISEPKVIPGRGFAQYDCAFRAVVWKPFKGEVVDGVVTHVIDSGFFVDVSGLNVFVSRAMMPTSFKYQVEASNECWSEDPRQGTQKVERDSHVRLRIKGTRSEVGTIFAIGSILEDYLGPLMDPLD